MNEEATLLYLETDDEVTSVARRLRGAGGERVVLVAPGRSRATSSVVALRLLARVAEEADRRLAVVGDALTRSLAAEAGLDAYASVEDARTALPAPAEAAQARRASIHVVRGDAPAGIETVALAAVSTPAGPGIDTETRAVPVVRTATSSGRASHRTIPLAVLLGGLAALVVGAGVLGATVLPAATVTVVPASEPLGPVAYEIQIDDPVEQRGTVEATAPVAATGTYPIQVAATGVVVFRNFNSFDVAVDAGMLVAVGAAAGDQAFETTEDVVVPAGTLTAEGTILAGEAPAGIAAAAIGPAANVPAQTIDTILDQNVAARLRGFGNNNQQLVVNPEAMAGGLDDTGTLITQQDVDTATASLRTALDAAVADALGATGDALYADPAEPPDAVVEGLDGLVETRDPESAEISGTLAYDRLSVDRSEVLALATERLLGDATVLPGGHQLVPSGTEVSIGEARRDGEALVVAVTVTGASTPAIDRDEVIDRVRGRSVDEAEAALAGLGAPTVDLWPGWVSSVPGIEWRIEVRIAGEDAAAP